MPGTIAVSVLELADLPSTSAIDGGRFSFKVALGKREYWTDGNGDFSFPVLSLRDDLVMTLHDAEGSEISRAVIKTMQVMENGIWDSWFPLDGGGNAHVMLQFLLNEDERKRIYERRESAIKTKYTDVISSGRRHSFSEEIFRPSSPRPSVSGIVVQKESRPTGLLQRRTPESSSSQLVSQLPQVAYQAKTKLLPTNAYGPEKSMDEHVIAFMKQKFKEAPNDACELQASPKRRANSYSPDSRTQIPGDLVETRYPASVFLAEDKTLVPSRKQNDDIKHSVSLVKKMVGAFESGFSQETTKQPFEEPLKKIRLRKTESTRSFEEAMSKNGQLGTTKLDSDAPYAAAETFVKSSSSGMLFKMQSEQSSEYSKSSPVRETEDQIDSSALIDKETSPMIKVRAVEYSTLLRATEDPLSTGLSEELQQMARLRETEEDHEPAPSANQHEPSADITYVDAIHKSCTDDPLEFGEHKRCHSPSANKTQSSCLIAQLYGTCSNSQDTPVEPAELPASVISDANNNSLVSSSDMEQEPVEAARKDSEHANCRIEYVASSANCIPQESDSCLSTCQVQYLAACCTTVKSSDSINGKLMKSFEWRSSRDRLNIRTESCFLWYPSLWTRRPCITTGTCRLIDILEGCDIFLGTYPQNSLADLNANEEISKHHDLFNEAFKDDDMALKSKKSNSEYFLAMPKMIQGLIKQRLSVIILAVACATLILNAGG